MKTRILRIEKNNDRVTYFCQYLEFDLLYFMFVIVFRIPFYLNDRDLSFWKYIPSNQGKFPRQLDSFKDAQNCIDEFIRERKYKYGDCVKCIEKIKYPKNDRDT